VRLRPRLSLTTGILALAALACSDALEQDTTAGLVIAVVNTGSNTLSFVNATSFTPGLVVDLTPPTGTPASLDARGSLVLVPMGTANALRAFSYGTISGPSVIALPVNSGATGVAIQDDSLAWVANPNLNSVTRVNYRTGDTLPQMAVGVAPRALALVGRRVFVVNSNAPGGTPAGASWLTSFDCCGLVGKDSIALTGTNARAITLGTDGFLYVVLAGTPTAADGKLSIVDPAIGREVVVLNGLGVSPGPAVYHPSGRLLIASASEGILEVNALTRAITRGRGAGVKPGGAGIAALALDPRGRVYAVAPGACASPGTVHILSGPPDYRALGTVTVGVCPAAAALTAQPPIP
jgi:streptogramin lyase